MKNTKYILTDVSKELFGVKLFQIKALITFGNVSKDELGGWIEKEENLSVSGDAWVYGNARVYGNASVSGDAWVSGNARVYGNASVSGDAWVYGNARVYGNASVSGDARVYGNASVSAKLSYTKGKFVGGDDSETPKFTNVTNKMGNTYWKNQYVIGDYKINEIEETKEQVKEEDIIELNGKKYKLI